MKAMLGQAWKGLQVGSVTLVAILLALILFLTISGTVTLEGLDRARTAMATKPVPPPEPVPKDLQAEWEKIRAVRERMDRTFATREEELKSFQDKTRLDLQRMEKDREDLEKLRAQANLDLASAKAERKLLTEEKIDAVTEANLPIFSKMEGQELADLMVSWKDPEIVRYLRLLKASKSAEVLQAMQQPNGTYPAARLQQIVQILRN